MSNRLDKHQLENVIEQLFKQMEKKGILIADDTKDDIKKELSNELANQLTHDEIQDPNLQKKLISAISAFVMGKKEEFEETIDLLKDEDKRCELNPELDKKLEMKLKALLALTILLKAGQKKENTLTPNALDKKINELFSDKNTPAPAPMPTDAANKELEMTVRNLYGGDDPRVAGEIPFPVFVVFGNLFGNPNLTIPDPNSEAFMTAANTYNPSKADPLGLENLLKEESLSNDIVIPGTEMNISRAPRPGNMPE